MAKVTICLLTYARTEYAKCTLQSCLDGISYSGYAGKVSVHIADDGSEAAHRECLYELAGGYSNVQGVTISNSERGGYGKNVNLATQVMHSFSDYVLMLEDDWELVRSLDLDALVNVFEAEPRINCIRMGYMSFTQRVFGEVIDVANSKYFLFDPASPEPHVFAGHPRFERVSYQRQVGAWPENLAPGATEFSVAHRVPAKTGVVWPMDLVAPRGGLFCHIGTVRSTD